MHAAFAQSRNVDIPLSGALEDVGMSVENALDGVYVAVDADGFGGNFAGARHLVLGEQGHCQGEREDRFVFHSLKLSGKTDDDKAWAICISTHVCPLCADCRMPMAGGVIFRESNPGWSRPRGRRWLCMASLPRIAPGNCSSRGSFRMEAGGRRRTCKSPTGEPRCALPSGRCA